MADQLLAEDYEVIKNEIKPAMCHYCTSCDINVFFKLRAKADRTS
jgi:hypothetical protein